MASNENKRVLMCFHEAVFDHSLFSLVNLRNENFSLGNK